MKRDILYVDDELDNIVVFETAFEDEFNIHTAASGQEALAILDRMPIPVIVADQRMPEMTGVELFEIVRQKHPHSKRILLTGYTEPDAMLDAINKGRIFYFIKKPWERPMLLAVLIRALETYDLSVANTTLTDRLIATERGAMLGRATARITHEMGNQLSILPLIELIESNYSDQEELVKIAHFARETYDRLVALIQEVKDFMRVEHEQFTKQPLSLADTVHELVSFLRFDNTIPHEQFTLQVHADPVILANKIKVQQVIVNLLKNASYAIRNRPDGRIVLTIDREGDEAVLQIADTGCGMSAEVLERIWEPYFTTKGEEGNGLGLDISRQLIEGHDGTISCDSLLDVGTTFTIRMPTIQLHNECVSTND